MVYLLVGLLLGDRPVSRIVIISLGIAIVVELFRLYHRLDTFRLTLWGKLLLGRLFALWEYIGLHNWHYGDRAVGAALFRNMNALLDMLQLRDDGEGHDDKQRARTPLADMH